MIKMRYLLILSALSIVLFAGEIQFEHDFNKALQKAKSEHKEVMMMYSATWCPECNYMKEVVFITALTKQSNQDTAA